MTVITIQLQERLRKLAAELGKDLHGSSAEALSLPSPAIGLAPELVLQDARLDPKIGIIVSDPAEVISPEIRLQWLSKTTGVGDWLTNPGTRGTCYPSTRSSNSGQSASTSAKSEPITSYCGPLETVCPGVLALTFETVRTYGTAFFATAYAIYLPFATATGAVAGEIDAQRWNFCKDDFMQKVREANPANEIIDTVPEPDPGSSPAPAGTESIRPGCWRAFRTRFTLNQWIAVSCNMRSWLGWQE